ncbi:Crp/Fnr family transcriptional regulator [Niabella sp. CC-SYL272]|uniref:Crp/Fnr family transcriptional regulator n=1 Tax=Niabella agricola TaxID=2891571 RepID=UPI001F36BE58|nr:Crp/Fnr family transcriptional regulator [Niabella agricola]MCF3110539.1 Crp/Fnr family transcriptional regulator [Niabella agricola]
MHTLLIQHIKALVPLTKAEELLIAEGFHQKNLKRRQFLVQEGDFCRYLSFVTNGCLRSYFTNDNGQEYIVQFGIEGWWLNDNESFLYNTPSQFNIEALEATTVLQIDRPGLEHLYQNIPQLERFFRILYQRSFIMLQKRVIASMSQTAEQRYREFADRYPEIVHRIPQYQLAAYLGMSAEFLSKIRHHIARKKS